MATDGELFFLVVRDTFRLGGDRGAVVTGRVAQGRLRTGDPVDVLVAGVATRTVVLALERERHLVEQVQADQQVAIRIRDVEGLFASAGDTVSGIDLCP